MTEKYKQIPVSGPSITPLEIARVTSAVQDAWYSNAGKYVRDFETAFAAHCQRKYAISLPSCTSGLHLALLALGIGPGDEVIVPDVTWIASSAPISYVGATPVFCDIESSNLCLSAETVERALGPKVRAIIAVNLYGAMPDYTKLLELCERRGIHLIEDAAESIGSTYKNLPSGKFGAFSAFSFHGSKTLTTGEGGMLVMDDPALFERCSILRDHGRRPGDTLFQNQQVGYKYKMSDLQAALGHAQLERISELVSIKRKLFESYREQFSNKLKTCQFQFETPNVFNSYWMSSIVWDRSEFKKDKLQLIKMLSEFGISTRPVFSPLTALPAYQDYAKKTDYKRLNPNSYKVELSGINLPSALNLTNDDTDYVVQKVEQCLRSGRH